MPLRKPALLILMGAAALVANGMAQASTFEIDANKSRIRFEVGHHDYAKAVKGRFHDVSGAIAYDAASPATTSIEAVIESSSVDTGNRYRDSHLRASFLEVSRFPEIRFRLTRFHVDEQTAEGELTVKGVKRKVILEISRLRETTDADGIRTLRCRAKTVLNRREFGIAESAEATSALGALIARVQAGLDEFIEDAVEIHISVVAHETPHYARRLADVDEL